MSLRKALERCLADEPERIFGVRDIAAAAQRYHDVTFFQAQPDPRHGQTRYVHEVRSTLNRMKSTGTAVRLGRNQWAAGPHLERRQTPRSSR